MFEEIDLSQPVPSQQDNKDVQEVVSAPLTFVICQINNRYLLSFFHIENIFSEPWFGSIL
jgi:hypothetical protein